jgi:hypothetical protein
MKRSTTGLRVRFLSVTTLTGHGRDGKSSGSIFKDLKCATDRGIAVINRPSARKWVMTDIDSVTKLVRGMAKPRVRNSSERTL